MKGLGLCLLLFLALAGILGYAATNGFGIKTPAFAPLNLVTSTGPLSTRASRAEGIVNSPHLKPFPVHNPFVRPSAELATPLSQPTAIRKTRPRMYSHPILGTHYRRPFAIAMRDPMQPAPKRVIATHKVVTKVAPKKIEPTPAPPPALPKQEIASAPTRKQLDVTDDGP